MKISSAVWRWKLTWYMIKKFNTTFLISVHSMTLQSPTISVQLMLESAILLIEARHSADVMSPFYLVKLMYEQIVSIDNMIHLS